MPRDRGRLSLAPEHAFPAAVDDSFAATTWIARHASRLGIDANRIAVGGDSAAAILRPWCASGRNSPALDWPPGPVLSGDGHERHNASRRALAAAISSTRR